MGKNKRETDYKTIEVIIGRNPVHQQQRNTETDGRKLCPPPDVLASLIGQFSFVDDQTQPEKKGLRRPQIGAVYSVLGHWSTGSTEPATVVMPTGTGKTETMLCLMGCARPERLLVLVPSDALRDQLATKFETWGVLKDIGVIGPSAGHLAVGQLRHAFKSVEEAKTFASKCNVIIATPHVLKASDETVRAAITSSCSHLFVDEAHHVVARTWSDIRDRFGGRSIVQFTATPFRSDGRVLGGRLVYSFPLREAQKDGYFSHVNYFSVFSLSDQDQMIAEKALDRLRQDLKDGYDHLLFVRVRRIGRALELLPTYQDLASDLNPVILHSKQNKKKQKAAKAAIEKRNSRVILCVDMLGEGFDLPALKVAAIHDVHKSLGVTLQFIGRFSRSSGKDYGEASVFAGRPDVIYDDNLRQLYAEDSDWNLILRDLSQAAVGEQQDISDFEAGFDDKSGDISIRSILPKMSTVIYRTSCSEWRPDRATAIFPEDKLLTNGISINATKRVAWFVTEQKSAVRWGDTRVVEEITYDLYVVYWDRDRGLLYINSSNNDSIHENLAKIIAGVGSQLIKGQNVYRVMAHLHRLVPTNMGVLDIRNKNRRFSMLVGADVTEGFPIAEAQTKTKTNIFAYGYNNGIRESVGASLKGRIWSHRIAPSLKHWVSWCNEVGSKVSDDSIDIDKVMGAFILPEMRETRPHLTALGIEWPWEMRNTSEHLEISYDGKSALIGDIEFKIDSHSRSGPIEFSVVSADWSAPYSLSFAKDGSGIEYHGHQGEAFLVSARGGAKSLAAVWSQKGKGLQVLFESEAVMTEGGLLMKPNRDALPFDVEKLQAIDWTGVNIQRESQGVQKRQDTVQARALQHLKSIAAWDFVIDDDGKGEVADLVAFKATDDEFQIHLMHCKYSSQATPGARLSDLYEVCGQAKKSARWCRDVSGLIRRLIARERRRVSRQGTTGIEIGGQKDLPRLEESSRALKTHLSVSVVQPGVSKAKIKDEHLELFASTEVYLREVANADFEILCSA